MGAGARLRCCGSVNGATVVGYRAVGVVTIWADGGRRTAVLGAAYSWVVGARTGEVGGIFDGRGHVWLRRGLILPFVI